MMIVGYIYVIIISWLMKYLRQWEFRGYQEENAMFREMSETELVIQSIENVRMISIYELTGIGDEPDKGCAAISIFYGNDKHINLCELDDGFDILADKVFEIYGDIEDKSKVVTDDRTRGILESGWQNRDEAFLERYYEMTPSDLPKVAFESAVSGRILPIAEYLMDAVYRILGIKYERTLTKTGWRGAGVIYGMINDSRVVSGVRITQTTEVEYHVLVNNFIQAGNVLEIIVNFGNAGIILEYYCKFRNIHGTGIYSLEKGGYTEFHEAFRDGRKIFRASEDRKNTEPVLLSEAEKKLIPWSIDDNEAVMLPWGMVYVLRQERSEVNSCVVDEYRCCFLFREAMYSENRCWTRIKNNDTKFTLKTSSVIMHMLELKDGICQVYFAPHAGNHKVRYRQQLEGNIFITD